MLTKEPRVPKRRVIPTLFVAAVTFVVAHWGHSTSAYAEDAHPRTTTAPQFQAFHHVVMATRIEVLLPATPDSAQAAEEVFAVFDEVDARMSEWKESSPLSSLNRSGGNPTPLPADLRAVIKRGLRLGEQTGGAFDITWAALWGLWDFKSDAPRPPSKEALKAAVARVNFRDVQIDDVEGTVTLTKPEMKLGLGGIAKGYALERAASVLRARNIDDFMLSAGGQILAAGRKGKREWQVGIRDPRQGRGDFFALLKAENVSVSTSGDYERYFIVDGVRYHHILDPRTGMPARGVRSVTIVAEDPVSADALSTAVMVMGVRSGVALLQRLPDVEGLIVDERGELHMTAGIQPRLRIKNLPTARDSRGGAAAISKDETRP